MLKVGINGKTQQCLIEKQCIVSVCVRRPWGVWPADLFLKDYCKTTRPQGGWFFFGYVKTI
jgi:hypothetical protein